MKTVYFIRHGESEGYVGHFEQAPETPLSEEGKKQSDRIASRLTNVSFDLLITSPLKRTAETAELIMNKNNVRCIENELFIERKRPSRQYGIQIKTELHKQIENDFQETFLRGEKFEDAESFEDIRNRAIKALKYLDDLSEDNIVVVTHGTFLRYLAALALLGENNFNLENSYRITKVFKKTNTGVSVFEKEKIWRIYSWNDFSHFENHK